MRHKFTLPLMLFMLLACLSIPALAQEAGNTETAVPGASVADVPVADDPMPDGSAFDADMVAPGEAAQAATMPEAAGEQAEMLVLALPEQVGLGQPFTVRLTSSNPIGDITLEWLDRTISPSVSVWNGKYVAVALLGTDVKHSKPGEFDLVLRANVAGEMREFRSGVRVVKKQYPEEHITVEKKMVNPPSTEGERIKREGALAAEALRTVSPERQWSLPLLRPVPGKTTSSYGYLRFFNGEPRSPHRGLDMRAALGQPVAACSDGVVVLTGDFYFAGGSVYVDHGNGMISMYFHLSEVKVSIGQTVNRGDVVGLAGATGRVNGPHLHFGVALQGRLVDPEPLFSSRVDDLL